MVIRLFKKFVLTFIFFLPLLSNAGPIPFEKKEIEDYFFQLKNKEILSEASGEELKVQEELFVPVREMLSSESLDHNNEEEPSDE